MAQAMVRVSEKTRQTLREISRSREEPMQTVLDRAVEEYRRRSFLEAVNRAFQEVREDGEGWAEELAEREAWDSTLADGLPVGEVWAEPKDGPAGRGGR